MLASSAPPPSLFLPWLQRHSSAVLGCCAAHTRQPLRPSHGRPAGQGVPSQEDIFSRSGIWLLGRRTSSCAGSRGWPGSAVCLGCCLFGLSPADAAFSLLGRPLPPHPSRGRGRGWGDLRAPEGWPPASRCGRTLETHLGTVSCQLAFGQVG